MGIVTYDTRSGNKSNRRCFLFFAHTQTHTQIRSNEEGRGGTDRQRRTKYNLIPNTHRSCFAQWRGYDTARFHAGDERDERERQK